MPQSTTGHVFISYSRKDANAMKRVVSHLREQKIKAWVDDENLTPGTPAWEREIVKAIKAAFAVVVILSPDANESEWVLRELTLADNYKKRVFPVLVRGKQIDATPFRLIERQYVDLRNNENAGLIKLSLALRKYLDGMKNSTDEKSHKEDEIKLENRDKFARLAAHKSVLNRYPEIKPNQAVKPKLGIDTETKNEADPIEKFIESPRAYAGAILVIALIGIIVGWIVNKWVVSWDFEIIGAITGFIGAQSENWTWLPWITGIIVLIFIVIKSFGFTEDQFPVDVFDYLAASIASVVLALVTGIIWGLLFKEVTSGSGFFLVLSVVLAGGTVMVYMILDALDI